MNVMSVAERKHEELTQNYRSLLSTSLTSPALLAGQFPVYDLQHTNRSTHRNTNRNTHRNTYRYRHRNTEIDIKTHTETHIKAHTETHIKSLETHI